MEGVGGKRKIEDEVEIAKQKAQAIAARLLNDSFPTSDSKKPRSSFHSPPHPSLSSPSFPVPYTTQTNQYNGNPSSKKIVIPNAKVGVIIGRGGEMIKNLQLESGAKIQITRDAEADTNSLTRDVELVGTQEQISRAQHRINEVIAESDATSTGPSGNRGPPPPQAGGEQFVMKVPNDKVALVIGKGGETIKTMQGKTGARIQVVPLRLPPGDMSTERNIYINGTREQIDAAKQLVNEVISGNRLKVLSDTNTYQQPGYPPNSNWAAQGQPPAQHHPAYGYSQPETYGSAPPPYYGGYPPQPTAWDPSTAQTQSQNTGYNPYGQTQPPSSTAPTANYNYGQGQGPPSSGYNYNQGYPQQPSYGQDVSGGHTAPGQVKSYPNYGPPVPSSQPDSQLGYANPAISGQPDGTTQSQAQAQGQAQSTYASGYGQPPANGDGSYPGYSGAPPAYPGYNQTGYSQMGYGQQPEGQVAGQASYSYYGQSGYPPSQPPTQGGYYSYPPTIPPPQVAGQTPTQPTNGASGYADGGDSTTGSGAVPEERK